jgi:ABC-type transport system substrate-binding protein
VTDLPKKGPDEQSPELQAGAPEQPLTGEQPGMADGVADDAKTPSEGAAPSAPDSGVTASGGPEAADAPARPENDVADAAAETAGGDDDDDLEAAYEDDDEIDEADVAAWAEYDVAAMAPGFGDIPAQRLGRRGFLVGLAAAGVPIAGLVRLMDQAGGGSTSVPAPAIQQSTPGGTPAPAASPSVSASPVASPDASPEASPEPVPVDPFGELTVIRDQEPVYVESPAPSDTLRLMLTLNQNFEFNPAAFGQDFQIMASYLDPLVWIDERTMEPKPWLARSWRMDDDGRRIIFSIRDDVTWHDGTPLTPEDIVFSLLVYRDDTESAIRNPFVTMENATVVGEWTVAVELSSPDANFIPNAASQFIFQREALIDYWESRPEGQRTLSGFDWEANPPVGTGPWIYANRERDSLTFERNEAYWAGDPPHFQRLVFTWDTDPRTRIDAWRRREADLLFPVRQNELELFRDLPGLLYAADAPVVMFAQFNQNNPARLIPDQLADVRVRRALSLAIDRRRYAADVFLDFIDIAGAGTFPQPWLRDETLVNPSLSRRAARELLNEAGYRRLSDGTTVDPNGEPFALNVITRLDARFEMRLALRHIVEDLAGLGISLRLEELGDEAFNERWIRGHDFDLIAFSYQVMPGFTDFDLYGSNWDIRINPQGWNPGGYSNRTVDGAIRDALNAESLDDLMTAVQELQVAANDDLFGLWLGFPQDLILAQPDLLGFQPNMHWQTWDTRTLWRRPAGAAAPDQIILGQQ